MKKLFLLAALLMLGRVTSAQEPDTMGKGLTPHIQEELPAYFSEGILSFHADIQIHPTGIMRVTEHIRVSTNLHNIKKGIFRTIPIYRKDVYGRNVNAGIHVIEVLKDGIQEPYHESEYENNLKIRIGDADKDLQEGTYDYTLTYETSGQVGFFEGYDELYWNVTGSDWQFPIVKASATVTLPYSAKVQRTACYTGVNGSAETDCRVVFNSDSLPTFHTNRQLDPGSGITIAVAFTPGSITRPPPPTMLERLWNWFLPMRAYILALIGSLIMLWYCYFTWRKHGEDPVKPVVVPTFEPPGGLSPGAIRYLYKKMSDNTGFTASLINMAIKKTIQIKKPGKDYVIEKGADPSASLPAEERAIFSKLFNAKKSVPVKDSNHKTFTSARMAYSNALSPQFDLKSYYLNNTKQIVIGGLITGAILCLYMLAVNFGEFFIFLFLLPFIGVGSALLLSGIRTLKDGCTGIMLTVIGGAFTVPALIALFVSMKEVPPIAIVFIITLLAGYYFYIYLIKAPTPTGAEQTARIEGFMMYLQTAEEHRLNMLTPPEHTPQLFEKLLPYAIALDLENEWGAKFENVLAQAAYNPDWYDGKEISYNHLSSSFSAGLISSISSAQIDPTSSSSSSSGGSRSSSSSSWSSGSSGGGSSGGGGGGGGGGGW